MFFPKTRADIVARIINSRPNKNCVASGYRPAFKIRTDYLTTGVIKLIGQEELAHGDEGMAEIWFITPEYYPHCLEVGQTIQFQEGAIIHGYIEVVQINNKQLEK